MESHQGAPASRGKRERGSWAAAVAPAQPPLLGCPGGRGEGQPRLVVWKAEAGVHQAFTSWVCFDHIVLGCFLKRDRGYQ